jgi:hypothetical protein
LRAIVIEKRKTGKSKQIQDAFFCGFEGCMKPAKYEVTFLDHYWDKWHLCDNHAKEEKEILNRLLPEEEH